MFGPLLYTYGITSRDAYFSPPDAADFANGCFYTHNTQCTHTLARTHARPINLQERSSSSLLVLDLGHIAFRRDDTVRRAGEHSVESPRPNSQFSSPRVTRASEFSPDDPGYAASGAGVPGQGMLMNDPLVVAGGSEDVAQNDWRLDVSGVQVILLIFKRRGTCVRAAVAGKLVVSYFLFAARGGGSFCV